MPCVHLDSANKSPVVKLRIFRDEEYRIVQDLPDCMRFANHTNIVLGLRNHTRFAKPYEVCRITQD